MDKNLNNEIPESVRLKLDSTYKEILESENTSKKSIKKVTKVATIAGTIITLTLSTGFALEYMIEYFKANEGSKYISTQEDVNSLNKVVNKSVTDQNIEFTVDSIAADDNYINIFYTIKSENHMKALDKEWYEDPFFAAPHMWIYANGIDIVEVGMLENEAKYISDTELKGIRRVNISSHDIPDKFNLDIKTDEIFKQEGKWEISFNVDKTKGASSSKKYNINKDFIINKTYKYDNETINIDHKVTIEKIVMSPIANQMIIKERLKSIKKDWSPSASEFFALFDQDGLQLEVIDKGSSGDYENGIQTSSFEFITSDKEITSLKYVPINYNDDIEGSTVGSQSIDNLPMEFNVSKYGKWIIDKVEIKDSEMLIYGRKEGFINDSLSIMSCDENGEWLDWDADMAPTVDVAIDRNNNNQIYSIKFKEKYKDELKKIKSIDMWNENNVELMTDQAVEIDLAK
ncbi:MAG: DUF4179 domain-containing protein [Peptostreptococcaceae bacterium]